MARVKKDGETAPTPVSTDAAAADAAPAPVADAPAPTPVSTDRQDRADATADTVEAAAAPVGDPTPIAEDSDSAPKVIEYDIWRNPTDRNVVVRMPQRSVIKPGQSVRLNRVQRKAWLEMAPQLQCVEPPEAVEQVSTLRAAMSIGDNSQPARPAGSGE